MLAQLKLFQTFERAPENTSTINLTIVDNRALCCPTECNLEIHAWDEKTTEFFLH
jgi:hypothetical protein